MQLFIAYIITVEIRCCLAFSVGASNRVDMETDTLSQMHNLLFHHNAETHCEGGKPLIVTDSFLLFC